MKLGMPLNFQELARWLILTPMVEELGLELGSVYDPHQILSPYEPTLSIPMVELSKLRELKVDIPNCGPGAKAATSGFVTRFLT